MLGAVIDFPTLGLAYVVGSGWFTPEGEAVGRSAAYRKIRRWYSEAAPEEPSPGPLLPSD